MHYVRQVLATDLRLPLSRQTALRLFYHFETGRIADWHYSGLDQSTVVGNRVYLDAGPGSYHVNLLGALVQMMF